MTEVTPRSTALSPVSPAIQAWGPRSPIPPHRLAKLANALGVSTPVPAHHPFSASTPNLSSFPSPAPPSASLGDYRRSPTPSGASTVGAYPYNASTPKWILHVVPPSYLPHDSDDFDARAPSAASSGPPPPNTSGYHPHYSRGIPVPLHPTLSSQLNAIAREYALPSTAGLVLYLLTPTPRPVEAPAETEQEYEPGFRISEEMWKIVWAKALQSDREDGALSPVPRSATPMLLGLGLSSRSNASPSPSSPYPHDPLGNPALRNLVSPLGRRTETPIRATTYPLTPASSTPSSTSDIRSQTRSASVRAPSSLASHSDENVASGFGGAISASDVDLDSEFSDADPLHDDSVAGDGELPMSLPGLANPSAVVPILAKVEFAIDRRKATWYEPWMRSRTANHRKRAESRNRGRAGARRASESESGHDGDENEPERALIELELLNKNRRRARSPSPAPSAAVQEPPKPEVEAPNHEDAAVQTEAFEGYEQLPEDESSEEEPVEERVPDEVYDLEDTDPTTRVPLPFHPSGDPLADIFGTDEETWADIHEEAVPARRSRHVDPNVVDLVLDAARLSALPGDSDDSFASSAGDDAEEERSTVEELWNRHSRPRLSLTIPGASASRSLGEEQDHAQSEGTAAQRKRGSSTSTAATVRGGRHVPPPLNLSPMPNGLANGAGGDTLDVSPASATFPVSAASSTHLPYVTGRSTPLSDYEKELTVRVGTVYDIGDESLDAAVVGRSMLAHEEEDAGSEEASMEEDGADDAEDSALEREEVEDDLIRRQSGIEKRGGAFFEELELGLEPSQLDDDFDEDDPNDRRRSQYLMSAQLDEIEKALALLSPRAIAHEVDDDGRWSMPSPLSISPMTARSPSFFNFDGPSNPSTANVSPASASHWPAVPNSAVTVPVQPPSPTRERPGRPPTPPRLTINGVSKDLPKLPPPSPSSINGDPDDVSEESRIRRHELEEQEALYPLYQPGIPRQNDSPVIPLSPDPFGRYPSSVFSSTPMSLNALAESRQSFSGSSAGRSSPSTLRLSSEADPSTVRSSTAPSSRFSGDSFTEESSPRTPVAASASSNKTSSLVNVKSIKKLWRRSNKSSISAPPSASMAPPPDWPGADTSPASSTYPTPPMSFSGSSMDPRASVEAFNSRAGTPMTAPPSPLTSSPPRLEKERTRKSILKTWKSSNSQSTSASSSTDASRSSSEVSLDTSKRKRRPSIYEVAQSVMRGGSYAGGADIPPSPIIPEQYRQTLRQSTAQVYAAAAANGSVNGNAPGHIPPPLASPATTTASFHTASQRSSSGSAESPVVLSPAEPEPRPSYESSFDSSEFEMVSPHVGVNSQGISYPYVGLEHQ